METSYKSVWPNGMSVTTVLHEDGTAEDMVDHNNQGHLGICLSLLERRPQTGIEIMMIRLSAKSVIEALSNLPRPADGFGDHQLLGSGLSL